MGEEVIIAVAGSSGLWQAVSSIIDKLPAEYIMASIPFYIFMYLAIRFYKKSGGSFGHTKEQMELMAKSIKKLTDKVNHLDDSLKDVSLEVLKNSIYAVERPIEERIWAAVKFIHKGGNGDTKKYIMAELRPGNEQLYDQIEKIMRLKQ